MNKWDLDYFNTGEWQVVEERLNDLAKQGTVVNPPRARMFDALAMPRENVRVAIFGQDPYPTSGDATGIAFHTGKDGRIPPTLKNMFVEYSRDLGLPKPTSGNLLPWVKQGVFLWNVYPTCEQGKPGSHHWDEYTYLTKEIVEKLDVLEPVYVFLGNAASAFSVYVRNSVCIRTSHPSPLGVRFGFMGSSIFTRVNRSLIFLGKEPIDWRL